MTKLHGVEFMNYLFHPETKKPLRSASWNPMTGCTPISPGCANCWAKRLSETRMYQLGDHYRTFKPTIHMDRMDLPLNVRNPTAFFTCGMTDLFHSDYSDSAIMDVFRVIERCQRHLFVIPTKRTERAFNIISSTEEKQAELFEELAAIAEYDGGLPRVEAEALARSEAFCFPIKNLLLLVSVEDQETANKRIDWLMKIDLDLYGLLVEPMLGPIDLNSWNPNYSSFDFDWVIVGAETLPGGNPRQCDPAWVYSIMDQCRSHGVPFFFKKGTPGSDYGPLVREYPAALKGDKCHAKTIESML